MAAGDGDMAAVGQGHAAQRLIHALAIETLHRGGHQAAIRLLPGLDVKRRLRLRPEAFAVEGRLACVGLPQRLGGQPRAVDRDERVGAQAFAQPHVIGQAAAEADAAQENQPGQPTRLVRTQRADEAARRRQRLQLIVTVEPLEQVLQPAIQGHVRNGQAIHCTLCAVAQRQAHGLQEAQLSLRAALFPETDRRFHLLRPKFNPLSANLHQRAFQRGQTRKLFLGQRLFTQGQLPVVLDYLVE